MGHFHPILRRPGGAWPKFPVLGNLRRREDAGVFRTGVAHFCLLS
jgi:hypothetical protein